MQCRWSEAEGPPQKMLQAQAQAQPPALVLALARPLVPASVLARSPCQHCCRKHEVRGFVVLLGSRSPTCARGVDAGRPRSAVLAAGGYFQRTSQISKQPSKDARIIVAIPTDCEDYSQARTQSTKPLHARERERERYKASFQQRLLLPLSARPLASRRLSPLETVPGQAVPTEP